MHLHKYAQWSLPVSNEAGRLYQFARCSCGAVKQRRFKDVNITAEQIATALNRVTDPGIHHKGQDEASGD
jgi:hypothetical protein